MAVAQLVTDWAPASSLTVWSAPLANDGASFTGLTVIVNVWSPLTSTPPLVVLPLSRSRTVIVADPLASAAGVYVRAPAGLIAGSAENRAGFELAATSNVSACPASFAAPGLM